MGIFKKHKKGSFIRLIKGLRKYYIFMFLALIGMFLVSCAQLVSPMITRRIVNLISNGTEDMASKVIPLGGILLSLYCLQSFGMFLKNWLVHHASWNYANDLRIELYGHIQNLSLGFFHNRQTGELMSRITSDTTNIEPMIAHAIPDLILNGVTVFGSIILLFTINVKLALIALVTVPLTSFLVYTYSTKFRPKFKIGHEKMSVLNATLQDKLSGIREITAFNKQDEVFKEVKEVSDDQRTANLNALKGSFFFNPLILLNSNIGYVIVLVAGAIMAGKGEINVADVVTFTLYISYFYQPINQLPQIFEQINNSLTAIERVFEMLDTKTEIVDGEKEFPVKKIKGKVEFRDVSFSYNDNKEVLSHVSLLVEPGKTLALVGPTGIGKTTMVNLISRFYDANSGKILVDDIDVKELKLKSLRSQISTVLQDVFLFHGTIMENIAFGCENATKEQIIEAAKLANAHEFIMETENGYDTLIGERGIRLSGGQKQRVSIARAILRNTPILVLDEATSSVDNKTEKLIQEALDRLSVGRTTIVIAHRLSTIRNADIIAVMGENGIVEQGIHDELMAKKGAYYELVMNG